jgi:hypothetical protein
MPADYQLTHECKYHNPNISATKMIPRWAPAAHTYNPSYSGGRDQEDHNSKLALSDISQDPISKSPSQKQGW